MHQNASRFFCGMLLHNERSLSTKLIESKCEVLGISDGEVGKSKTIFEKYGSEKSASSWQNDKFGNKQRCGPNWI